jgi:hypothetical protein
VHAREYHGEGAQTHMPGALGRGIAAKDVAFGGTTTAESGGAGSQLDGGVVAGYLVG